MGEAEFDCCPLPGHIGTGSIDRNERGELALWCDCLGADLWDGGRAWHWYSLSDAYFAVQTGTVLDLGFKSKYRGPWRLLLHADLGLIEAPHVELPALAVSDAALRTGELFARLYAAQVGAGWPEPGTMAVGLVRQWLGCSRGAAHEAIKELVTKGVIAEVEKGTRKRASRYMPGRGERA